LARSNAARETVSAAIEMRRHPLMQINAGPSIASNVDAAWVIAMTLPEILIAESDAATRQALAIALTAAGHRVSPFADGEMLLAAARRRYPSCILLDMHLPRKSGLEILRELRDKNYPTPIIVISERATVESAVEAFKSGALDFFERSISGEELVDRVREAIERSVKEQSERLAAALSLNLPGRVPLSGREQQILRQLLLGKSSKEIGLLFSLSPRTIEDHRAAIKRKTGTRTLVELIRVALGSQDFGALIETATKPPRHDVAIVETELRRSV
jgi:FixJ family two-component response regulator